MIYKVQLSPHAARQYKKLDPSLKSSIQSGIDVLARSPLTGSHVKRLKGRLHEYHRYRIGDYRIVYTVSHQDRIVYVDYIQHRNDVYRSME